MFDELNKSSAERLAEEVDVSLQPKAGWVSGSTPSFMAIPTEIVGRIANERQLLFDCYSSIYDGNLDITNLRPSKEIKDWDKSMIHFYLGLTMKKIEALSRLTLIKRLLWETEMPFIYDHVMDLGYKISPAKSGTKVVVFKELK